MKTKELVNNDDTLAAEWWQVDMITIHISIHSNIEP